MSWHIRVPVEDLDWGHAVRVCGSVREDDTAERVSLKIGTVGVEFTSFVGRIETDTFVAYESDDLDVSGGCSPLH